MAKRRSWADAVRLVTSQDDPANATASALKSAAQLQGGLQCDAPPWDKAIYRIGFVNGRLEIQRHGPRGWEAAPLHDPKEPAPEEHAVERTVDDIKTQIFVSHIHDDEPLATALVKYIKECLAVPIDTLLCTSVPGHTLDGGDDMPDLLRKHINASKVVLGLLTPKARSATWVLLELGAAWGFNRRVIPLVTPDVKNFQKDLPGRFATVKALHLASTKDMASLIDTLQKATGFAHAAKREGEQAARDTFVAEVSKLAPAEPEPPAAPAAGIAPGPSPLTFSDSKGHAITIEHRLREKLPGDVHVYNVVFVLMNNSRQRLVDWELELELPKATTAGITFAAEDARRSSATHRLLRIEGTKLKKINPGDTYEATFPCQITPDVFRAKAEVYPQRYTMRAILEGTLACEFSVAVEQIQNY